MNREMKFKQTTLDAGSARLAGGSHSRQSARTALYTRLVISDGLAILIGFSVARLFRDNDWLSMAGIDLMWIIYPLYPAIALYLGAYSMDTLTSFSKSIRKSMRAMIQTFLVLFATFFITQGSEDISRVGVGLIFITTLIAMAILRYLTHRWVRRALNGVLIDELLIVDDVEKPDVSTRYLVDASANGLVPDLDSPTMLERFAQVTSCYDRIIVACREERQSDWATVLKTIDARGEIIIGERRDSGVLGLDWLENYNTFIVSRGQLDFSKRFQKRVLDLSLAILALVFLAPLLIAVAVIIKFDSPGPVLFKQLRVGKNNVPFHIYKFRSMRQDACDSDGRQSTRRGDSRISRFGAFLRRTSIDEIPQLFNVLKSEMSIVGPRPHALGSTAETQLFWEINRKYWERHSLKPGITGLAQVRGYRGATDTREALLDRLQSDLEYLEHWSIWTDLGIILSTAKVLIHPNAY